MDKLCTAVAVTKASSTVRAYLLTALTKLAAQHQPGSGGGGRADAVLRPEAREAMHKAHSSRNAELQQRAHEAEALLRYESTCNHESSPVMCAPVMHWCGLSASWLLCNNMSFITSVYSSGVIVCLANGRGSKACTSAYRLCSLAGHSPPRLQTCCMTVVQLAACPVGSSVAF